MKIGNTSDADKVRMGFSFRILQDFYALFAIVPVNSIFNGAYFDVRFELRMNLSSQHDELGFTSENAKNSRIDGAKKKLKECFAYSEIHS